MDCVIAEVNPNAMLKNYFLVAFRSLKKNKSYIIINTFGLGIALACCVTAYLMLAFNIEFDNFHSDKKVDKIFRVHSHLIEKEGKKVQNNNAPIPLAPRAAVEIAGIERFTRFVRDGGYMRNGDKAFSEGISFADSTFFEMFDFVLLQGDFKSFKDKYNIVITDEQAKKYFADEPALGKILTLNFANNFEIQATVGAVIKKIPENSSFVFNTLMRIENLHDIHKIPLDNWGDWRDPSTFLEITKIENAADISKQLGKYAPLNNEAQKDNQIEFFRLEHFKSNFSHDDIGWGYTNMRLGAAPIVVFTAMAAIILLIACFNLTNTSIAMTAKRLREVGVRKAVGALRQQIVSQFLLETMMTITLSLIVGLLLAQWIVPVFTNMWDLPFALKDLSGVNMVIMLVLLVFFASLIAGIYPALFNSKFKPVALLKGQVKISGTNMLTQTLTAFQFALSVIVLIGGVVFIQNARFQEEVDFGYDKEKVLTVNIQSEAEYRTFKNEIQSHPKIQNISVLERIILKRWVSTCWKVGSSIWKMHLIVMRLLLLTKRSWIKSG
jgi:putative ABC transport system permease protein